MPNQVLSYVLLKNHLQEDSDTFMPKVVNQMTVTHDQLLSQMENNTMMRKQDILLAEQQQLDAISNSLALGMKATNLLGTFKTSLRGTFESLDEEFRPYSKENNHDIAITWIPSRELKSAVLSKIKVERVWDNSIQHPSIIKWTNVTSPKSKVLRPGDVIKMRGINLKVDTEAEDEGVFWINEDEKMVRNRIVIDTTSSSLCIQMADLSPGTYTLRIATRLGNHLLRDYIHPEQFQIKR